MEFTKKTEGKKIIFTIKGRIDTNNAPELMESLDLSEAEEVIFDLKEVDYVFSAGLRVFLQAQKIMNAKNGSMKLINVQPSVKEIFEIVGFNNIMTIE